MGSDLPGGKLRWRARGLSDGTDGTNVPNGSMSLLQNLVPDPSTRNQWVPRPPAVVAASLALFKSQFANPQQIEVLEVVGNFAYGVIATNNFPGHSVPFCFNLTLGVFNPISGVTMNNTPVSQLTAGDWVPPISSVVGNLIIFTHPGFPGGATKFGWLDISGFSDTSHTGNTHGTTTVDNLSANVLSAGWYVGLTIQNANNDFPVGTTIVAIASNGLSLTTSVAATASHNGSALTVAGGTQAAPLWNAGDVNGFNLVATPVSVQQFNGRAYFAVNNSLVFTDADKPLNASNATQAVTFRNGLNVTAIGALGLYSTTTGGVVQSLIAFQSDAQAWQVQGDSAFTGGITVNALNSGVGTNAPNSITQTPLGLAFIAPDGLRMIDFTGKISDPIGADGDGVNVPFLFALAPSRITAAYNQNILRITVQNSQKPGLPFEEYWLHFNEKVWSGPHTFPAAQISAFQQASGAVTGHGFIMAPVSVNGSLWESDVTPGIAQTFVENGINLSWDWQTVLLPDNDQESMNAVIESTFAAAMPSSAFITIVAVNEIGQLMDTVGIAGSGVPPSLWGGFNWGAAVWGVSTQNLRQYQLPWTKPLVFKQARIQINGFSVAGLSLGNLYMRVEDLGYILASPAQFVPGVRPATQLFTDAGVPVVTDAGIPIVVD